MVGELAGAQPIAHRAAHAVGLVGGQIGKDKLGAVEQLHHQHVAFAESVGRQAVGQAVARLVQRSVSPRRFGLGTYHGGLGGVASHVAHKAFQPRVAALENGFKICHHSCFAPCRVHLNSHKSTNFYQKRPPGPQRSAHAASFPFHSQKTNKPRVPWEWTADALRRGVLSCRESASCTTVRAGRYRPARQHRRPG